MSRFASLGRVTVLGVFALIAVLTSCAPPQSTDFTLPEGDAERGKETFMDLGCTFCHTVDGVEGLRADMPEPARTIVLGGEKSRVYTYGELVTSIINPSHKISQPELGDVVDADGTSEMVVYNDIMTVTEMTDLVTFLAENYSLQSYRRSAYPAYGPL